MSMFTLRHSDPRTVLLWGHRWWLPGEGVTDEFGDAAQAVACLVDRWTDEPKPVRLRLIYQPDGFDSVAVDCPCGDRATLAAALAVDHPALANPTLAWSHEPVLPTADGYSTLLHHENEPMLFELVAQLAQRDLIVESAWPLGTFLHALPNEWTETGAITVVAVEAECALAYRHPADGTRSIQTWHGLRTVSEVGEWLAGLFERNAEEPVLLVYGEQEIAAEIETHLGSGDRPGFAQLSLAEALVRPVVLSRSHPAQLLPRTPVVTAQRMLIAASIALLLASGWGGAVQAQSWFTARTAAHAREARLATLRTEVGHLRENASEIAALRSVLDGSLAGPPCGALLERLSATVPAEIALASLRLTGRTIAIEGWLAPAAPAAVLTDWCAKLNAQAPWKTSVQPAGSGAFTLSGEFP